MTLEGSVATTDPVVAGQRITKGLHFVNVFKAFFFDDPNFSTPKFSSSSVLVKFTMRNKNFPHNHEHRKILAQSIVMFPNLFLVSQHHFFFPNLGGYRRRNQLRPAYFALITMKFVARSGNYFECFITYLIVDFFLPKRSRQQNWPQATINHVKPHAPTFSHNTVNP